jgi:NADH-quinone oxidoreductase subunit M
MIILVLAVIAIIYGALVALVQPDFKKLVAYSSVSHMGIVLLGISALGTTGIVGATYQMLAHGVITGLLFVMIGLMYERTHTREIGRLGGLSRQMPLIATGLVFAGFASLGLPALGGFIAEVLVFLGTFERYEWAVLLSIFGVVLSAGYVLWMLQRVTFGPVRHEWDGLEDQHHWWEHAAVLGLAAFIVLLGVYPKIVTDMLNPAVESIVLRIGS